MDDGYIKLWRCSLDSKVFKNTELWKLWCLCLFKANHKDIFIKIDSLNEPIKVKKGQFITGRFSLHRDFYQDKKRKKSPFTLWRLIKMLQSMENLIIETNNKYTLITIVNWDKYQSNNDQNAQQNAQQMHSRCTADEHKQECIRMKRNKKEKIKKRKNKKFKTKPSNIVSEKPDWLSQDNFQDILKHREKKRANNTPRALKSLFKHFLQAKEKGYDIDECVDVYVECNWQGFNVGWYEKYLNKKNDNSSVPLDNSELLRQKKVAEETNKRLEELNAKRKTL